MLFTGQTQNDMDANQDRSAGRPLHRIQKGRRIMPAVDRGERPIMDRLESQLQPDMASFRIGPDQRQRLLGQTIRARADGEADHILLVERLIVECPEFFNRRIGVCKGLEVGDEFFRPSALAVESLSPADLVADRRKRARLTESRSPAVAIDASPLGNPAVTVRAGKSGVDRQLVHPAAEAVDPVTLQIAIPFRMVSQCRSFHGNPFQLSFHSGSY